MIPQSLRNMVEMGVKGEGSAQIMWGEGACQLWRETQGPSRRREERNVSVFFVFFMAIAFCTLSKKICLLQACEDSLLCFPPETVSLSFLHLDL